RLFAQVRGTDRLRELPGAPFNAQIGSNDNTNADTQVTGEVGYNQELAEGISIAGRAYGDRYTFDNHLVYGGGTPDFDTSASSIWYGGELRLLGDFIKLPDKKTNLLSITTGANYEQTMTKSTSSTTLTSIDHNGCEAMTSGGWNFSIAGAYV